MVLPWGIRGHHETGDSFDAGIEPGSPIKANIGKKMLITTAITTVIWGIIWIVIKFGLLSIR